MAAGIQNNVEILKILLENRADVNATHSGQSTPLYKATIMKNNFQIIKCLIEYEADVNSKYD